MRSVSSGGRSVHVGRQNAVVVIDVAALALGVLVAPLELLRQLPRTHGAEPLGGEQLSAEGLALRRKESAVTKSRWRHKPVRGPAS